MFHVTWRIMIEGQRFPWMLVSEERNNKASSCTVKVDAQGLYIQGRCINTRYCSLYLLDIKPFYFMSNACEEVKWKQMTRQVWHRDLQKLVDMPFFCLNLIHD